MCVSACCHVLREAWGGRLAQLKQQELQEVAEARERAAEVRVVMDHRHLNEATSVF
jgi:hypothetical protein